MPVIDTVIIRTENVFGQEEATSFISKVMNGLHFTTAPTVVARDVLLGKGDRYDPLLAEETERNLRSLGIFRAVSVDTVRLNGGLALVVDTKDGWSTKPKFSIELTGGNVTGHAGLVESNLLGFGNFLSAMYRKDPDRSGLELITEFDRLFGSDFDISGSYESLSDGKNGTWDLGFPFRALTDGNSLRLEGDAADERVLQYRTEVLPDVDTTFYWHRRLRSQLVLAAAPQADGGGYVRLGGLAEIRDEEFMTLADTAMAVPDSVTATLGAFVEYRRARYFQAAPQFNGFGESEDVDISATAHLTVWIAATGLGYERNGLGPKLSLSDGREFPSIRTFVRGRVDANGLFTSAGLDSGRVELDLTAVRRTGDRHTTLLYVMVGAQENPPPGEEFDLGHGTGSTGEDARNTLVHFLGPRSFDPHSFTGTRTAWGTLEHRWTVLPAFLNYLGIGLAAFLDYGGAWYTDQDPRAGGNVGVGLRFGGIRGTVFGMSRIDLGYRFGDGWEDNRLVFSFGGAYFY